MKKYVFCFIIFLISCLNLSAQLSAPKQIYPENDGTFGGIFQWSLVDGATSYTLVLSLVDDFSIIEYYWDNISDTIYVPDDPLASGEHYFWQINATDGINTSPWSEVWSFCIGFTTYDFELLYPSNGSDNIPINTHFEWDWYPYATSYELKVSTNWNFSTIILDTIVYDTYFCCSNLQNNTTYYWYVNALGYCIGWYSSAKWHFTTVSTGLNIPLSVGWNMNSSNIIPTDPAITSIFSSIANNVNIVKNSNGQFFIPSLGVNTIGNWNINEGYQINMNSAANLNIQGTPVVPEANPINLPQGWNIISYLRSSLMSIVTALASISNNIVIVKNNAGGMYVPSLGVNTISDMQPGQGYQVYLSGGCVLTYPGN